MSSTRAATAGCALKEQADARRQRDEGAEVSQCLVRGQTLGCWLPYRREIAIDQTEESERNHGRSEDQITNAGEAHGFLELKIATVFNFQFSISQFIGSVVPSDHLLTGTRKTVTGSAVL